MKIRDIPLDDLVLDQNLNLRDRLDDFTVERYADSWERLPPITVYNIDERLLIADGFHRHAAAVMLGKRTIRAEIIDGTFTDALDFVSSVNLFHGLPLTRSERRRAVEVKLKLHHDWSDRRMAEELAVSRELVAKIRRQLIEAHKIPNLPGPRRGRRQAVHFGRPAQGSRRAAPQGPAGARRRVDRARQARHGHGGGPCGRGQGRSARAGQTADPDCRQGWPDRSRPDDPRYIGAELSAEVGAATIDEMLDFMAKQIMQIDRLDKRRGLPGSIQERHPQRAWPLPYGSHQAGSACRPASPRLIELRCDQTVASTRDQISSQKTRSATKTLPAQPDPPPIVFQAPLRLEPLDHAAGQACRGRSRFSTESHRGRCRPGFAAA